MSQIQLGLNPLFLIPCVLVAAGFSLFLYYKSNSVWDSKWSNRLFFVRFFGVLALLILLLNPLLKVIDNQTQKPKIHLLVDDSKSIEIVSKDKKQELSKALKTIKESLKDKADVEVFGLESEIKNLDSIDFNSSVTNISKVIKELNTENAGGNHVATVLFSDGIVNQGLGLSNFVSRKPIYTIGIGDTTDKKDVSITDLFVNKSTYKGNEFPLQASVLAKGFKGAVGQVLFKVEGKTVGKEIVKFESNKELIDLSFKYTSNKAGYLKLAIQIQSLDGELTTKNNSKTSFIEVKESRKKLCIVAQSPHPDIKAIRSSIEKLDKYQVKLVNLSFNKKLPKIDDYDAFILHQIPCARCNHQSFIKQVFDSNKPRWIITGTQSDYRSLNKYAQSVRVSNIKGQDLVSASLDQSFDVFQTKEFDFSWLQHASPLTVPFARIKPAAESQVLFYQKVGSVVNNKPLFVYSNKRVKEVLTLGDGIWKWRLFEQLELGKSTNFDLLVSKLVGLLESSKADSQFDVNSLKNSYLISDQPNFSVTVKNNLGELVYDNPIKLVVKKTDSTVLSTSFKVSESNPFYKGSLLGEGVYNFIASTTISGKQFRDYGSFSVSSLQLESKNLQADFNGLRVLAENSGGKFQALHLMDQRKLIDDLSHFPNKIDSYEFDKLFNDMFWPLLLILLLFCIEWISRKLLGDV